jgi:hypothetical protein
MRQINNITDNSHQVFHLLLDDGTVVDLSLNYLPAIRRWNYNINHALLAVNGKILCNNLNILRQYRDIIPFGIMVFSADGIDPFLIDDFSKGRVAIYILSPDEVSQTENILFTLKEEAS